MLDIFILSIIVFIVWFWWDTTTKREIAIKSGTRIASDFKLQLLDDTVHCTKIRIVRTEDNWPCIQRIYFFYVSTNKENRLHCQLTLTGNRISHWHIPPYPQLH